jgi:hypothetical protein
MKIFKRLLLVLVFIVTLTAVIAYARGYRIDFKKKSFSPTGILALSSYPKAAKIYVNGELKGATDINLTLPPGQYQVEIKKDGFTSWSKNVKLKGELVLSLDALLFPINPSLSPLTNLGVVKAVPIDQTDRIILFTENGDGEKDGVYLFEMNIKPLSFMPPLKPVILKKDFSQLNGADFKNTNVYFSPDYKQAIFEFFFDQYTSPVSYLFSLDEENKNPFEITQSKETLLEAWDKEKAANTIKILETFPKEIVKTASESFQIVSFSPDETKMIYLAKDTVTLPLAITPPMIATNQTPEERTLIKDRLYLYDKKEDKNYQTDLSSINDDCRNEIANCLLWYADSKHLVFMENKKISLIDYDNQNKQTVYSGPFENSFFASTGDGKIVVLTNLNPEANKLPDLYLVGIR